MAHDLKFQLDVDTKNGTISVKNLEKSIKDLGTSSEKAMKKTKSSSDSASKAFKGLGKDTLKAAGAIATVSAALAVMKKGFMAVEEFNLTVASMASMMTNFATITKDTDIAKVYQDSAKYAEKLALKMEIINTRTITSGKHLQAMTETMIQQGVILDVSDKKQVDSIVAIANAITLVTQGQNQDIQMRQEIRGLLTGEIRQTNILAKMIDAKLGGGLKENLKLWRDQGTVIENVGKLLSGFQAGAEDLASTWAAVSTSLETIINRQLRNAFKPIYAEIIGMAQEYSRSILEQEGELVGVVLASETLSEVWITFKTTVSVVLKVLETFSPVLKGAAEVLIGSLKVINTILGVIEKSLGGVTDILNKLPEGSISMAVYLAQEKKMKEALAANEEKRKRIIEIDKKILVLLNKNVSRNETMVKLVKEEIAELKRKKKVLQETKDLSTTTAKDKSVELSSSEKAGIAETKKIEENNKKLISDYNEKIKKQKAAQIVAEKELYKLTTDRFQLMKDEASKEYNIQLGAGVEIDTAGSIYTEKLENIGKLEDAFYESVLAEENRIAKSVLAINQRTEEQKIRNKYDSYIEEQKLLELRYNAFVGSQEEEIARTTLYNTEMQGIYKKMIDAILLEIARLEKAGMEETAGELTKLLKSVQSEGATSSGIIKGSKLLDFTKDLKEYQKLEEEDLEESKRRSQEFTEAWAEAILSSTDAVEGLFGVLSGEINSLSGVMQVVFNAFEASIKEIARQIDSSSASSGGSGGGVSAGILTMVWSAFNSYMDKREAKKDTERAEEEAAKIAAYQSHVDATDSVSTELQRNSDALDAQLMSTNKWTRALEEASKTYADALEAIRMIPDVYGNIAESSTVEMSLEDQALVNYFKELSLILRDVNRSLDAFMLSLESMNMSAYDAKMAEVETYYDDMAEAMDALADLGVSSAASLAESQSSLALYQANAETMRNTTYGDPSQGSGFAARYVIGGVMGASGGAIGAAMGVPEAGYAATVTGDYISPSTSGTTSVLPEGTPVTDWSSQSGIEYWDDLAAAEAETVAVLSGELASFDADLAATIAKYEADYAEALRLVDKYFLDLRNEVKDGINLYMSELMGELSEMELALQSTDQKFQGLQETMEDMGASTKEVDMVQKQWLKALKAIADASIFDIFEDELDNLTLLKARMGGQSTSDYYLDKYQEALSEDNWISASQYLEEWYKVQMGVADLWDNVTSNVQTLIDNIQAVIDSIKYSSLNVALPTEKAEEAARDYAQLKAAALTGGTAEIEEFVSFATTYLQTSQDVMKSSEEYQQVYAEVMADLVSFQEELIAGNYDQLIYNELADMNTEINENLMLIGDNLESYLAEMRASFESKFSASDYASFAGGGIASGPSSGYLAELHGEEAVIPLEGGSIPIRQRPMNVHVYVGNEELESFVVQQADNVRVKANRRPGNLTKRIY